MVNSYYDQVWVSLIERIIIMGGDIIYRKLIKFLENGLGIEIKSAESIGITQVCPKVISSVNNIIKSCLSLQHIIWLIDGNNDNVAILTKIESNIKLLNYMIGRFIKNIGNSFLDGKDKEIVPAIGTIADIVVKLGDWAELGQDNPLFNFGWQLTGNIKQTMEYYIDEQLAKYKDRFKELLDGDSLDNEARRLMEDLIAFKDLLELLSCPRPRASFSLLRYNCHRNINEQIDGMIASLNNKIVDNSSNHDSSSDVQQLDAVGLPPINNSNYDDQAATDIKIIKSYLYAVGLALLFAGFFVLAMAGFGVIPALSLANPIAIGAIASVATVVVFVAACYFLRQGISLSYQTKFFYRNMLLPVLPSVFSVFSSGLEYIQTIRNIVSTEQKHIADVEPIAMDHANKKPQ